MGTVVRFNRARRRAHAAGRRAEARKQVPHLCACDVSRQAADVPHEVAVSFLFFHDLHRALGEPHCPLCPRCAICKRVGRIDGPPNRAQVLDRWERLLEHERGRIGP